jgi:FtsH-binding integral membrane protein
MTMAQDRFIPATSPRHDGSANDNVDLGLRQFLLQVYVYMAGALCLSGLAAYLAIETGFYQRIAGTGFIWLVILAPLVAVLFLTIRLEKMPLAAVMALFWIYACLMGLSLAGIFLIYTNESIVRTFFVSAAIFGATSLYGYATKADLSRFGSFLTMALLATIVVSAANILLASTVLQIAVSAVGAILFVGMTAYDTQRLKQIYYARYPSEVPAKAAFMGALTLYLDFINLFVLLLQLSGDRRR